MKFELPTKSYQQFEEDRRKGLQFSDQLRIESKSAIGFLLKGMNPEAEKKLMEAKELYGQLLALFEASPYLYSIGGVNVGTEEYVEARLLADYLEGKPLSSIESLKVHHEAYICGLCDMSGELLRYARKNPDQMVAILKNLEDLYQTCLEVIVTRNSMVRKKLEDLERNMMRMEEMIFQYNLKHS